MPTAEQGFSLFDKTSLSHIYTRFSLEHEAENLEEVANRLRLASDLMGETRAEWCIAVVLMMQALRRGRSLCASDQSFGDWLKGQGFAISHQDRAAYLNLAEHEDVVFPILEKTDSWSVRRIWSVEVKPVVDARVTSAGKPMAPKRRGRPAKRPEINKAMQAAEAMAARGERPTRDKIRHEAGVTDHPAQLAVAMFDAMQAARAEVNEEALAKAAEAALPKTAKEKLDIADRRRAKKQEEEFQARVQAEAQRRMKEITLPHYEEQFRYYQAIIAGRKGIFTKAEYNKILRCLHPDHVNSLGAETVQLHNEALILFRAAEIKLLDEKESPHLGADTWRKT